MSRAFVKEDADGGAPAPRYRLPPRDDPGFPFAAARALLAGADRGDTSSAEDATGYLWGDHRLRAEVESLRAEAVDRDDDRLASLAERFLRAGRDS